MMSLQFSGQSTFVALGYSKYAVFFSLLRKAIIVVPLTLILPRFTGLMEYFTQSQSVIILEEQPVL